MAVTIGPDGTPMITDEFGAPPPPPKHSRWALTNPMPALTVDDLSGNGRGRKKTKFYDDRQQAMDAASAALQQQPGTFTGMQTSGPTAATAMPNVPADIVAGINPPMPTPAPTGVGGVGGVSDPNLGTPSYMPRQQLPPAPTAPDVTMSGGSLQLPAAPVEGLPRYSDGSIALPGGKSPAPNYFSSSVNPDTGQPSIRNPSLSKLGKLVTVLGAAAQGAAIGSTQPDFGHGFLAAQQNTNDQINQRLAQQHQIAATDVLRQQADMVDTPIGKLPVSLAKVYYPALMRSQSSRYSADKRYETATDVQDEKSDTALKIASGKSHLQAKSIYNPDDPNDNKPFAANWNQSTGQYQRLDGRPIPNARPYAASIETAAANSQLPGRTPAQIQAQIGPRPASATYKGQTFPSVAAAQKAWGLDYEQIQNREAQARGTTMDPTSSGAIADAIINGLQPPDLKGLYRNGAAVRAELARKGFNLTAATQDWEAAKKYLTTINSTQQVRLRQNISTAYDSLDKIQSLYNEWQSYPLPDGFRVVNRAALTAAKNLPGRPGAVAQALDAQLADITAEIASVYMGGGSPTDHALELGAKNLSSDWNQDTFEEGMKQTRANLQIRNNSIIHGAPAGMRPGSPYTPGAGGGTPPPSKDVATDPRFHAFRPNK